MKQFIFIVVFLCSFIDSLQAKVPIFDHYDSKYGLANEPITVIRENQDGFIWLGTTSGVFLFDGLLSQRISVSSVSNQIHVQSLFVDQSDGLWIGTKNNGLLFYANNSLSRVDLHDSEILSVTAIIEDQRKRVWVGSNKGLSVFENNSLIKTPQKISDELNGKHISAIETIEDNKLVVGITGGFYLINPIEDSIDFIPFAKREQLRIHDLLFDGDGRLWIATSKKLLRFDTKAKQFVKVPDLEKASRILSIVDDGEVIWVATIEGGVFKINTADLTTVQYTYQKEYKHSLPEKNIMSLFRSSRGFLWVGGFSKGLSVLDLNLQAFGFETNTVKSINCARNSTIKSIERDPQGYIWLGTNYGLIKYNHSSCEVVNLGGAFSDNEYTVYSTRQDGDLVWISSSLGLVAYHKQLGTTVELNEQLPTFFSYALGANQLLVGTSAGLYEYQREKQSFTLMNVPDKKYKSISFREYSVNNSGEVFFPTSKGLLYLDVQRNLKEYEAFGRLFAESDVINVGFNEKREIFISVKNHGLYHLNTNGKLLRHYIREGPFTSTNLIEHIQYDQLTKSLWLSSTNGIIRLDPLQQSYHLFSGTSDYSYLSLLNASYQDADGQIFFAGSSGYVGFYPIDITFGDRDTKVLLKNLYLMNDRVKVNTATESGFQLDKPLSKSSRLDFGYKDKVIKFDFVALNFNNPQSVRYQYMLEPTSSSWVDLQDGSRQLIFSGLKAGAYTLKLKATDLNGVWSNTITQLSFHVHPAPWLSWQAYVLYLLLLIFLIFWYFNKKIKRQEQINQYLNVQIEKKTRSILQQKQIVEDLMERKNEIFSNVSHEFRTPITLILGPLAELQKSEENPTKLEMFDMIKRNSTRLLRLVDQMLKLAYVTENTEQKKEVVNISSRITMVVEPYIHMAAKNKVKLRLGKLVDVKVLLTEDAIETTIGNFLSNAIKYTPSSGTINVGTHLHDTSVEIYVEDSGCGMTDEEKTQIFERFTRLSRHWPISGAGIGLALVKEVARLNSATINHRSEVGKGSYFSITFPLHLENSSSELSSLKISTNQTSAITSSRNKDLPTVLIIEDNEDMLGYIKHVLKGNFNCLAANNGTDGIAMAIKKVPDIIICDVMMPQMDGFQVCRRLRSEMMTSHIPLVLLTAVDEKASRIKGWREHIDMYLNKPFDAEELNLQVWNILNIRDILRQSNHIERANDTYSNLAEVDQKFVRKLKGIFEAEYKDPAFSLKDMASQMCVNERQLQRKVNALLNMTPLEFLREFRLLKAAQSLKNGYQISITSDACGFNSVPYFSQLFKKHYGMTPKQYQNLDHKHEQL